MADFKLPGRLGDPDMVLRDEPRIDPRLLVAMKAVGLDGPPPGGPLEPGTSIEMAAKMWEVAHNGVVGMYGAIPNDLPTDANEPRVTLTTKNCKGRDGHEIDLNIFRPEGTEGASLPCVLYIHGGAMTIGTTRNRVHDRWCTSIALHGLVCISINYRNAWTAEGINHYPTGLNDCCAAVQYVAAHRADLGIGAITLQGESGGANLSIATTLRAKREGWASEIAGVYGSVPYIAGPNAYRGPQGSTTAWSAERQRAELPSLVECGAYFIGTPGDMAHFYAPNESDRTDPCAWPYFATVEDLKGLPPFVVSVNELDPLRDEGIAFYRKLLQAGVSASGMVNLGLTHAAELIFRQALPEQHAAATRDIAAFAKQVATAQGAAKL